MRQGPCAKCGGTVVGTTVCVSATASVSECAVADCPMYQVRGWGTETIEYKCARKHGVADAQCGKCTGRCPELPTPRERLEDAVATCTPVDEFDEPSRGEFKELLAAARAYLKESR